MNGEETTTIGAVAESQANISTTEATPNVAQDVQPVQTEQPAVADNNWTWTSSWDVQTTQTSSQSETPEDVINEVNAILNENKTLNDVAAEDEQAKQQKENEDALDAIVKEQTKDLPSKAEDVKADVTSSTEETDRLDEELKKGLEDIKDKKTAEEMAKKMYLAFQKERSMHQFDNEQNANTIEVLKNMTKKLNEQVTSSDNDPRYQKLDDEFYTLWRLEQAHQKDKSDVNRKNLTRYYAAKLAVLNPQVSVNKIMDTLNGPLKSNTMWEGAPTSAPVAEAKKPAQRPSGIPISKRGMY